MKKRRTYFSELIKRGISLISIDRSWLPLLECTDAHPLKSTGDTGDNFEVTACVPLKITTPNN
jgi:hypothetical protein